MHELLSLLKESELFGTLPDELILREILPHTQIQEYRKGQFIIEPQQRVDRFALVCSGKVNIMHIFPDGNYSLMSALTRGGIMGADLICTRTQRSPYHAMAAAASRLLYFPADMLMRSGALTEHWRLKILEELLTLISHENMRKEYRLAILSQKGIRERILTYLSMQASRLNSSTFTIPFSREELAAFLCVNRSSLSHELSLMQQEGVISFDKNTFTVRTTRKTGGLHEPYKG